jgi:hypothetical protein
MPEHEGVEHLVFGELIAEAFDHEDRLSGPRDDEIELAGLEFLLGGEEHERAVNEADPHG